VSRINPRNCTVGSPRGFLKFAVRAAAAAADPLIDANGDINLREIAGHDNPSTTRIGRVAVLRHQAAGGGVPHQPAPAAGRACWAVFPRFNPTAVNGYERSGA